MSSTLRGAGSTVGWMLDSAVLGTVVGLIVSAELLTHPFPPSFEDLVQYRWRVVELAAPYVGLGTVMGLSQGALLSLAVASRRFFPPDIAPALFSVVGLITGTATVGVWLALWADWVGGCLYSPDMADFTWLAMVLTYAVGSMLLVPLFGVMRCAALANGGRGWALAVSCSAAVVLVAVLWREGFQILWPG